jgi:hypothetical protein
MVTLTLVVKEDIILKTQASIASVAYRVITELYKTPHLWIWRVWFCLQSFLTAIAKVSKILWPGNSGDIQCGHDLMLAVKNNSSLFNMGLKNEFEQYERLYQCLGTIIKKRERISNLGKESCRYNSRFIDSVWS